MKLAVVGATGLVGSVIIRVLEEGKYLIHSDIKEFIPVASEKSVGKEIGYLGKDYKIVGLSDAVEKKPDVAIFSAGASTSLRWAPEFSKAGTIVIDNSSAWRLYDHVPLVVPEVNLSAIKPGDRIIANPNCSTIQLALTLAPLHKYFRIKRLVVSTYQSVTGSGIRGVRQLKAERLDIFTGLPRAYPHQIDLNLIPQGGDFTDNGYTTEELKLVNETRKILDDYTIMITSTVVRVPVYGGHSESVNIEFHNPFVLDDIRRILQHTPGLVVVDDPGHSKYPMPLDAEGKDEVFVGRIRRDESQANSLNLWIVADNLRKGAATNAVQIAASITKSTQKQTE